MTFTAHVRHMNIILDQTARGGFEFKVVKGQYNQAEMILWGCICDTNGRWPQPKQIKQLEESSPPHNEDDGCSFLAFVNYLRKLMAPEWI